MALRNTVTVANGRGNEVNIDSKYLRSNQHSQDGETYKEKMRRPSAIRFIAFGLLLCTTLIFFYFIRQMSQITEQQIEQAGGPTRMRYAIVFDAGSTGTRIHVYRFEKDEVNGALRLKDELFEEVKPGLSSFVSEPAEAGRSIVPLLVKAQQFIPESDWHTVPLSLYATAGLRLVSDSVAQRLLQEVRLTFSGYSFRVCADCVRILDGLEEGTFAWYTINYLLGLMNQGETQQTVGAIDLGGGSVQITFLAQEARAPGRTPSHMLHETSAFGSRPLTIYSHSYLGLGLNAARFGLLAITTLDLKLSESSRKLMNIDPDASITYRSPCLAENYAGKWRYQSVDLSVQGISPPQGNSFFDACYPLAQRLVTSDFDVHHPDEVHRIPFYIQSYFFDRAVDAGLIDEQGATVTVSDYEKTAHRVCDLEANKYADKPFLCMDLCYILALLRDGFEFDSHTDLMLKKKIKGFELSWSVGAVFPLLQ